MSTVRQGLPRLDDSGNRTFKCQWCQKPHNVNLHEMTWDCDPMDATAFLDCNCGQDTYIIAKFTEGLWHIRLEQWKDED